MKPYFSIFVFILISDLGFSQSSNRLADVHGNSILDERSFPKQYLWSYSRSNSGKTNKSLIDFNAIDLWRGLGNYLAVIDDGKFFAYSINKRTQPRYCHNAMDSLVVQSTRT